MNIGKYLTFSSGKVPDKIAIICGDVRLSYKELNNNANRVAHTLMDMGLKKKDKVAMLSLNSACFPEIFYGILKAGGVFVPLNFRLSSQEILSILSDSDAKILFFEEELADSLEPVRKSLSNIDKYICIGGKALNGVHAYQELVAQYPEYEPNREVYLGDECEIIYTSGTTGKPKGVVLTHENVMFTIVSAIIGRDLKPGLKGLVVSPMYHVAGLNNHLGTTIALGGTAVIIRQFDSEAVMKVIQEEQVQYFPAASTIFNLLVQQLEGAQYGVSSVVQLQSGAAITPVEVRKKLAKYFPNAPVYEAYGLTEVGDGAVFLNGKDSIKRPDSVGKAGLFAQVRVVDNNDQQVKAGEVGEIVINGPVVTKGYYKEQEETEKAIRFGWLHTGDLGRLDDEGFLYVVGRKKDMIISGGENIYPREIEEILWKHEKIQEAAVIGVPDKKWGETVRAIVRLKPGEKLTEKETIDYCKQHIASYKKPRSVIFVSEIPKNPSGKTLKSLLREKHGASKAMPD